MAERAEIQDTAPVTVERVGAHVVLMALRRPPHNYFDVPMVRMLADLYAEADADPSVRVIVLASEGRSFSAGANFGGDGDRTVPIGAGSEDGSVDGADDGADALYAEAARVFSVGIPVVAAVHGTAIGGGFGLAVSADFRVAAPGTRFCANFARLGIHHGFGLTVSLPRVIGEQHALDMLLTGRRVHGIEAHRIGLADRLVDDPEPGGDPAEAVRAGALSLAAELAEAAPLAVRSIRATQRAGLAEAVAAATPREASEQRVLRRTADFAEGVAATAERRTPRFTGS
ncbi:enoyl-CoA hydratase/isomerase family protein [Pseudonocardia endophytica]|uniref:Enoyl-CoA hydratase/carnithine racemase n=1 Tax=Pseudonocardia endophytica TaxID=401976 RepID=A0A4V2PIL1_PSEEN|nr:enoyl-CoA hydratase/isomerase family protein [Pseudonocardia endophytica]TCK25116.1 enoyl-CoA hydratase/carnithine racemase [Pseudonocardia endophytica]